MMVLTVILICVISIVGLVLLGELQQLIWSVDHLSSMMFRLMALLNGTDDDVE